MKKFITAFLIFLIAFSVCARQPQKGYRGFLDWSNSYRTTETFFPGNRMSTFYSGISTSHGYQFNPRIFAGAGLDIEHCSKISSNIIALYAHGRTDLKFDKFTPFGDIRLGYNMVDGGGVYFSPSIGYRFNWGRKLGINLGLGLTVQGYTYHVYEINITPEGYLSGNMTGKAHSSWAFFSFRLGIDF